jgi:outer membrane protein assembly factor BamB
LVEDQLFVSGLEDGSLVAFDPGTGRELARYSIEDADTEPRVGRAIAAGLVPPGEGTIQTARTPPDAAVDGIRRVAGGLQGFRDDGEPWSADFGGEEVVDLEVVDDNVYVYVATEGASGVRAGAIVNVDPADGSVRWREQLPPDIAAADGAADIEATTDAIAVAGGERFGVLHPGTRELIWTDSVVELGKSRGYALPGATQWVAIDDSHVYLSTTPDS